MASMNSGSGPYSYTTNSTTQKDFINGAKDFINQGILEKLDLQNITLPHIIRIADLGCSTGPNTFLAVQHIIDAIQRKCLLQEIDYDRLPEFQVFFNDHASNDFNTLFRSLPPNRRYCVAGVPGSFHGPLFPSASLHIVHSSASLVWISKVPVWNQGMIFYSEEHDGTIEAFRDQFSKDMDCFLHFRAKEVIPGGLMILAIQGRSNESPHSQLPPYVAFHLLGSCLVDMAKKGIISEEQVDSFNIPIYFCTQKEVESAVERNGDFSVERVECMSSNVVGNCSKQWSSQFRAALEVVLKNHFGGEIMDQLFHSFTEKLEDSADFRHGKLITILVLLKRKL